MMKWDSIVAVKYNDETEDTIIAESKAISEDLEELVKEMRPWAKQYEDISAMSDTEKAIVTSYHRCADELQAVLEE